MYLDAVYENSDVIFNGFPMDAVGFLLNTEEHIRGFWWVVRGENLKTYSCEEYLEFMQD
jgi:hypothetical protein